MKDEGNGDSMKRSLGYLSLALLAVSTLFGTTWVAKTRENYPVISDNETLYVINNQGRKQLLVDGCGPKNGYGRWSNFKDQCGMKYHVIGGIAVITDASRLPRQINHYHIRVDNSLPSLAQPNDAVKGGFRGNATLPSMDDSFPYNKF